MSCYICLVNGSGEHHPACAICQRCGAALCDKHLVMHTNAAPIGLGGNGNPRYLLVCQRCSPDVGGAPPSMHHAVTSIQPKPLPRWHRWPFHQQKPSSLPDPHEAISGVEAFLKKQRRQKQQEEK